MPVFDSMAQCAAQTGIPRAALQAAKKGGCQAFRHGRVDVGEFLRWWFARDVEEVNKDWTRENKRLDALTKEVNLAKLKGEVIEFAEVNRFISAIVANCFFAELDRLSQEFPPALKGKDEVSIHHEVVRQAEAIKARLRGMLDEFEKKGTP